VDIRNSSVGKKPRFMGDDASTVDGARYETISKVGKQRYRRNILLCRPRWCWWEPLSLPGAFRLIVLDVKVR